MEMPLLNRASLIDTPTHSPVFRQTARGRPSCTFGREVDATHTDEPGVNRVEFLPESAWHVSEITRAPIDASAGLPEADPLSAAECVPVSNTARAPREPPTLVGSCQEEEVPILDENESGHQESSRDRSQGEILNRTTHEMERAR